MPGNWLDVLWILGGAVIGARAADIDLAPVFPFRHRSGWTHGPLVPLAGWLALPHLPDWARWLFLGFTVTYAIHLLLDCLPKNWKGSANIKWAPMPWAWGGLLSFAWIAAGVAASVWVLQRLVM